MHLHAIVAFLTMEVNAVVEIMAVILGLLCRNMTIIGTLGRVHKHRTVINIYNTNANCFVVWDMFQ